MGPKERGGFDSLFFFNKKFVFFDKKQTAISGSSTMVVAAAPAGALLSLSVVLFVGAFSFVAVLDPACLLIPGTHES